MDNRHELDYYFNNNFLRCTTWWVDTHIYSEMITKAKLINIPIFSHSHSFLHVVGAPEIYTLSKLPVSSVVVIVLTKMIMLNIITFVDLFILNNCKYALFDQHLPISSTSSPVAITIYYVCFYVWHFLDFTHKWEKLITFFPLVNAFL